jgi:hypothetical protein
MHVSHPTLPKDGLPIATAYTVATRRKVLKSSLRHNSIEMWTPGLVFSMT